MMDATHLRALGPLLYKIACTSDRLRIGPHFPDEMERGSLYRVGGETVRFAGFDDEGRLRCYRDGCAAASYYPPDAGEQFGLVWRCEYPSEQDRGF